MSDDVGCGLAIVLFAIVLLLCAVFGGIGNKYADAYRDKTRVDLMDRCDRLYPSDEDGWRDCVWGDR